MSDFELPVLQPQLLTMSDKDTPFREEEMRQVLEQYTTYDKTQINSTLREVKMIVNSNGNASNPSALVSSDSFRDGVDWKQFFVDFINAMVGSKRFIQFTLLGPLRRLPVTRITRVRVVRMPPRGLGPGGDTAHTVIK